MESQFSEHSQTESKTFDKLLTQTTSLYGISYVQLEELLKNKGVYNIHRSRLSEYGRKVAAPPFDKARAIMDALDYSISDDELRKILKATKLEIRLDRKATNERGYLSRSQVYVGYNNIKDLLKKEPNQEIIKEGTVEEQIEMLKGLINNRVMTVIGEKGNISRYVEKLIADDLLHSKED